MQDKVWQHPPDTADFEQLAGGDRDLKLREVQDGYEVSFKRPATSEKGLIVEGRLVIGNATMRPVAETLRVQDGDDTREYQFKSCATKSFVKNKSGLAISSPIPMTMVFIRVQTLARMYA
jgi:hypothetical protein